MIATTISPIELARMRAEGTVYRCLDCDFIGIGAPVSYHTLSFVCPGHRIVTEAEYAALFCADCGADLENDGHEPTCRFNTEPPQPFEDRWEPSEDGHD